MLGWAELHQAELLTVWDLCRVVPAVGIKDLLLEAGYFAGDFLIDSIKGLFDAETKTDSDDGFDFDQERT